MRRKAPKNPVSSGGEHMMELRKEGNGGQIDMLPSQQGLFGWGKERDAIRFSQEFHIVSDHIIRGNSSFSLFFKEKIPAFRQSLS